MGEHKNMKNYKIIVQYDGNKYNGWQRQGNTKNTIQERFENVLFEMRGTRIEVFASGRTDAGVHAEEQVANFKCDVSMTANEIMNYLNKYLPQDIRVINIEEVNERFHSRLNAVSKTYQYSIATGKPDVFIRKYVYPVDKTLDVDIMKKAAAEICGTHDFKGFSSIGRSKKSTIRTINNIDILEEKEIITITINGNGFLYNMVRIIAGTLFEIGTGDRDISAIQQVFETKDRQYAGVTLPACGLKLLKVFY